MNRIGKEIKENLIADISKLSMIFLQLLLCFVVSLSSFISYYETKGENDKFKNIYGEKQFMRILDGDSGEEDAYEQLLAQPNYLGKMKSVYNKMMNSEVFTYLPEFTNPIYLSGIPEYNNFLYKTFGSTEEDGGIELDSYDGNTDIYYCVNSAWVGKGVLETYGLEPESGRFFGDKDLVPIYPGDTVPIILGAEYKEYYNLGDHIKGDMFIANVQFEVIGFLKKSATMKLIDQGQSKFVQLDNFAVVPLPDYPNTINTDDEDAQRMIYNMKIHGFSYSDKDPDTVQSEVNKICGEVGFQPKLKVQSSSNYEDTELLMDMSTLTNISFALSLILVVFSVMTFSLTMVNSIRNNMRYYAVLMTNGYTYFDITKIILAAPLLVETAALVSGSIIMFIIGGLEYISLLLTCILCTLVIALIIFAIISAVTIREFKCHDLANYLRKK